MIYIFISSSVKAKYRGEYFMIPHFHNLFQNACKHETRDIKKAYPCVIP